MRRWSELPRWLRPTIVLLALLVLGLGMIHVWRTSGRTFEAERWRNAAPATQVRGKMAGDLVASRRLIGITRAAALALLGPPQAEERSAGHWRLRYNLGAPVEGYGIDDDILDLSLDANGVVTEANVYSS